MSARRLHIDYVAAARGPRLAGFVVLVLALATAGVLLDRFRATRSALDGIAASQGLLGAERVGPRAIPREKLQEEAKGAAAAVRQLALPWRSIIDTVEGAATPEVAILQLQPDAQQRLLRLVATARNQEAMLEYVRTLAAADMIADPHVVNHQVRAEEPGQPVQFTVQASLRGLP